MVNVIDAQLSKSVMATEGDNIQLRALFLKTMKFLTIYRSIKKRPTTTSLARIHTKGKTVQPWEI